MAKIKFYAYYILENEEKNIVNDWAICEKSVKGKKARYKSFMTREEAQKWLDSGANYEKKETKLLENVEKLDKEAIYFDAGTGRGNGVEVRLTDYNGSPLLYKIIGNEKINEYGNYYLSNGRTNNFGELVGLFSAIKYALKYNINKIFGDSNLVIEYWSKGRFNEENLDKDTIDLIKKVTIMRKEYENKEGKIEKISGDINPADLGFHK